MVVGREPAVVSRERRMKKPTLRGKLRIHRLYRWAANGRDKFPELLRLLRSIRKSIHGVI